ncbi:protein of unknown function [Methylocaldum szegediense]|uniref:Uncharacterized protein n=1 Tax=Methylocaldum szegediense TaxID=73780 RepID=A0ABM9I8Y0_9GAMM|nr:protein of unknown function [Methylocaldum szegediense]
MKNLLISDEGQHRPASSTTRVLRLGASITREGLHAYKPGANSKGFAVGRVSDAMRP